MCYVIPNTFNIITNIANAVFLIFAIEKKIKILSPLSLFTWMSYVNGP